MDLSVITTIANMRTLSTQNECISKSTESCERTSDGRETQNSVEINNFFADHNLLRYRLKGNGLSSAVVSNEIRLGGAAQTGKVGLI